MMRHMHLRGYFFLLFFLLLQGFRLVFGLKIWSPRFSGRREGEGRQVGAAGEKKFTIRSFAVCFCFSEDRKSAAGARYATFALFSLTSGGGG